MKVNASKGSKTKTLHKIKDNLENQLQNKKSNNFWTLFQIGHCTHIVYDPSLNFVYLHPLLKPHIISFYFTNYFPFVHNIIVNYLLFTLWLHWMYTFFSKKKILIQTKIRFAHDYHHEKVQTVNTPTKCSLPS